MKIAVILKERHHKGRVLETFEALSALLDSDRGRIYAEESLDRSAIAQIKGEYSAILCRHSLHTEELCRSDLPIFAQHENPLGGMNGLSKRCIYLSDEGYLSLFPKAEKFPSFPIVDRSSGQSKQEKAYDVLYIGSGRKCPSHRAWATQYVGHFGPFPDIMPRFLRKCPSRFPDPLRTYGSLTQEIRFQRRQSICAELYKLAVEGYRIGVIGSATDRLLEHENTVLISSGIDEWSEIRLAVSRSRILICTTPFHQSILNERFVTAVEHDVLPLCEPYPQYMSLHPEFYDHFCFDYDEKGLAKVASKILEHERDFREVFRPVRHALFERYSSENILAQYAELHDRALR